MKKYIFALIFLTILSSCDKKSEVVDPESLEGSWELQNASCYCFFPEDFDFGQHKLEFDLTNKELSVENASDVTFITGAGTYKIDIDSNRFRIKNTKEYSYNIEGSTLTLIFIDDPNIADDEISLIYKKI